MKIFGLRIVYRRVRRRRRVATSASKKEFEIQKAMALEIVTSRIEHFNQFYGFTVGIVRIRNQISRWGSCSKKGNLNFNHRLIHLRPELVDYLVVHELCHIREFNHAKAFWNLVEKTVPNYNEQRRQLKVLSLRF